MNLLSALKLSAFTRPLLKKSMTRKAVSMKKLMFGTAMMFAAVQANISYAAKCEYIVANDWGSGFTATVRITNNGTSGISGWSIGWNYSDGSRVTSSWNATLTGSNPYSAAPLNWNSNIAVNSSVEFGVQGTNGSGKAQIPVITGAVCNSVATSSTAPSSIANSSIPRSSTAPSSVPRSSSVALSSSSVTVSGQACNWYGTITPLCANTTSGWGYESGKSCVSRSTCSAQPSPYGIVNGGSSSPVASSRSASSVIQVPSSSRSSVRSSVANSSAASSIQLGATCNGYATRYWDCCKAHCSWTANVPSVVNPLPACGANNSRLGDVNAASACGNGGGSGHMCWGMAPFSVNDKLAYGYAATASGDVCGRCYQLEFTGQSHNSPGDPGSAALAGKVMIVQATNIGYDVGGGQFDILVPGGGVGAFNACSTQWGVSNSELGAQYGGFLAACKQELGYNASLSQYKTCLTNRCNSVFGSRGLTELQQACTWYANWFEAADNPALKYKEVACPAELTSRSGMNRGALNDIKTSCN
ncbi:MAG TPA: cellulose binding domain-containing protein [Cellvibrio sp.]|nr:cellulose binding domain-containing protein [Cellvibrio sp.]